MDQENKQPQKITTDPKEWLKKPWVQNAGLILVGIIGVYSLIYFDVVSRAKESFMEAEKYMVWHQNPEQKKTFFEEKFSSDREQLNEMLKKGELSKEEYEEKLEILVFDKEFHLKESSLKYAYQWYKDTYELFSPPESQWVTMARTKTEKTLLLWKDELRSQKVPFEDYMFE